LDIRNPAVLLLSLTFPNSASAASPLLEIGPEKDEAASKPIRLELNWIGSAEKLGELSRTQPVAVALAETEAPEIDLKEEDGEEEGEEDENNDRFSSITDGGDKSGAT